MDMHIHMGYCTPEGFDVLAFNYLGILDHPTFFPVIKDMIREFEITPAEIAEHLMRNEDVDLALQGVLELLEEKKKGQRERSEDQSKEKSDAAAIAGEKKISGDGGVEEKGKRRNFLKFLSKNIKFARQCSGKETKNS